MDQYEVTLAGFGGQGIMTAGQLLAYAGIEEGLQVTWLPSYGPEMRGGTAYCTVVLSSSRIGSPIIISPRCVCSFNRPSFDKFVPRIAPGGLSIVNSSLIDVTTDRKDITELLVPANDIAMKAGNAKAANIAVLGALVEATGLVSLKTVKEIIKVKLARKKAVLDINMAALEEGRKLAGKLNKEKVRA